MDRSELYKKDFEELKRRSEEGGIPWWRIPVGKNMVRLLPHWSGKVMKFYKRVLVHWNVGDNEKKVNCRKMLGEKEPCPVCEFIDTLLRSQNSDDVRYGEAMLQDTRFAMNILDGKDLERGVQVMEIGRGLQQSILWMFSEGDYGDIDDWEEGRYIMIDRQGTGKRDTRYQCMPAAKVAPIDKETYSEELLDLDHVYRPLSYDDVVAIMEGKEPGDDVQAKEEREAEDLVSEKPAPVRRKPRDEGETGRGEEKKKKAAEPPSEDDFEPVEKTEKKKKEEKKPVKDEEEEEEQSTGRRRPTFTRSTAVEEKLKDLKK